LREFTDDAVAEHIDDELIDTHDRGHRFTYTVLSNMTRGAWTVSQRLDQLLATTVLNIARYSEEVLRT
jgi:hypothetical protein